jgi:hypothetical protein
MSNISTSTNVSGNNIGITVSIDTAKTAQSLNTAIDNLIKNIIPQALSASIKEYAEDAVDDINSSAPAAHLRVATTEEATASSPNSYAMKLKPNAPDARAWEFGSGLHATRGQAAPYPIAPKNPNGRLVFYWKREGRLFVGRPGQAISHPGIKAEPYIYVALRRQAQHITKIITDNLRRYA